MQLLSPQAPTRKELYRGFLRRFNPAANPEDSLNADLIETALASDLIRRMVPRLLLRPGSQHLLIGGIGSGKSTHLKLLQESIQVTEPATLVLSVDVSKFADLRSSQPGAIILAIVLAVKQQAALPNDVAEELTSTFTRADDIAHGHHQWVDSNHYHQGEPSDEELAGLQRVEVPGRITPPAQSIRRDIDQIAQLLQQLRSAVERSRRELVLVLDGMDRLLDQQAFWQFVDQDFAAIRKLGISLVATAPLSLLYAQGRSVLDHFDSFEAVPAIETSGSGLELLLKVLRRRNAEELIDPTLHKTFAKASGGILRDLISLVQDAAQNAYLEDSDAVMDANANDAIRQLGNSYLLGLGPKQRNQLKSLRYASFSPTSKDDLDLLISRRLIERTTRYEVHPALLKAMGL